MVVKFFNDSIIEENAYSCISLENDENFCDKSPAVQRGSREIRLVKRKRGVAISLEKCFFAYSNIFGEMCSTPLFSSPVLIVLAIFEKNSSVFGFMSLSCPKREENTALVADAKSIPEGKLSMARGSGF